MSEARNPHRCSQTGCSNVIKNQGSTSAHAMMYLHLLRDHGVQSAMACHPNCKTVIR